MEQLSSLAYSASINDCLPEDWEHSDKGAVNAFHAWFKVPCLGEKYELLLLKTIEITNGRLAV